MVAMIELPRSMPINTLAQLKLHTLAIRRHEEGMTAYFDFSSPLVLNRKAVPKSLQVLESKGSSSSLSFSGWVGFFGYEFLAANLGLSLSAPVDLDIPDGWMARPRSLIHFEANRTRIESEDPHRLVELKEILESANHSNNSLSRPVSNSSSSLDCNLNYEKYQKLFDRAKEAILDGETYQIKISQRFHAKIQIEPLLAFEKLNASNPAPEAFLLQTPTFSMVSCSPEVVIDRKGPKIITRPIGGTYERKDSSLASSEIKNFLDDPKEIAEHNMLVDLERNDLSAVCEPGSVKIEHFREVETYSHLHHLVSTISGTLKPRQNLQVILRALLPGGSITGCPKIRTMEWIDRLEPCFRGPYTGSFGIIEDSGDLHLNLIIRSMITTGEDCFIQAGGGIVVDSVPSYEFNENRIKAQALLDLLP